MLKPAWISASCHRSVPIRADPRPCTDPRPCPGPWAGPGFRHHAMRFANQATETTSGRPSPSTSTVMSLKSSMYCCVKFSSRNRCLVHDGASYQFSPETMSRRPSRLMSATAAVSLAPGSIMWTRNGMSGGRGDAATSPAHRHANTDRIIAGACSPASEIQPRGQLDAAGVARRRVLAELRVDLLSGGVEDRVRVHGRELDVVERVVELASERGAAAAAHRHVLGERDVPVQIAGTDDLVAARGADAVRRERRRGHALGLERPCRRSLTAREVRIADEVDAGIDAGAAAPREIAHARDCVAERERGAAEHRGDPGQLPVVEDAADGRRIPELAETRDVVRVIDDEVVVAADVRV